MNALGDLKTASASSWRFGEVCEIENKLPLGSDDATFDEFPWSWEASMTSDDDLVGSGDAMSSDEEPSQVEQ